MALDHPYNLACAYWTLAYLQIVEGKLNQAVGLLERVPGS